MNRLLLSEFIFLREFENIFYFDFLWGECEEQEDELLMNILASHVGNLLSRCRSSALYNRMTLAYEELCNFAVAVLDCDVLQIFELLRKSIHVMLEVRKCNLFLLDEEGTKLWTIDSEHKAIIRLLDNISTSVLGQAASSGDTVEQALGDCVDELGNNFSLAGGGKPYVIGYPVVCTRTHHVIGVIESITQKYVHSNMNS
jgi:hypothetical protein